MAVIVIQITMASHPKKITVSFRCSEIQQAMINELLKKADKERSWGHTSQSELILNLVAEAHAKKCK